MSSITEERRTREKREHSAVMFSYKKAIENIVKKGRVPGAALDRMNELKLKRMRKLQFDKSIKKIAKSNNGEASKS
tara:strand:- start:100 stop:327 length:228 start_codon:yes stop_codon:yes gene_type:complete